MRNIFTIGYEGATLSDFLATLDLAGVDTLLDVREIPTSRRRGFSKSALSAALLDAGFGYRHERRLGSPTKIRHRLRQDKNYTKFFRDFRCYLNTQTDLLDELIRSMAGNVALMCYERDPNTCHRHIVAGVMESLTGKPARHLGVKHNVSREGPRAASSHLGEGISTA